jgi:acetyl esterase/lipase
MRVALAVVVSLSLSASAFAAPSAIFTDPAPDPAHPAQLTVLHIPTHGVKVNGVVYRPSGVGPHPTLVLFHGFPGNEKNLDLAQAARRAGWNAVSFNYRGSWGSPGVFRFAQNLEDADAVLAYLRDPANAKRLGVDPQRIAVAGHSMGGWIVASLAAHDHELMGAVLISAADMAALNDLPRETLLALMNDSMEALAGVTADSMVDDLRSISMSRFSGAAPKLVSVPLLVLTSDDGLAPTSDALVRGIQARGGKRVTALHVATDHSWSDHRIALESAVLEWLAGLK